MEATGTLTALFQPSLVNTCQNKLIYLIFGYLRHWLSGASDQQILYSDVDFLDNSSQERHIYCLMVAVKLRLICSVFDRELLRLYPLLKCLTVYLQPSCRFISQQRTRTSISASVP